MDRYCSTTPVLFVRYLFPAKVRGHEFSFSRVSLLNPVSMNALMTISCRRILLLEVLVDVGFSTTRPAVCFHLQQIL